MDSFAYLRLFSSSDILKEAKSYVAIKVLTTFATSLVQNGISKELKVLSKIVDVHSDWWHPGFRHCLALRDSFWIRFPEFTNEDMQMPHLCLVTDPLGPNLCALKSTIKFTLPTVKRIVKQVLLAIDYLHRECGYMHGGKRFQ